MRSGYIITLALLLLGIVRAQEEEFEVQYYTHEEWAAWKDNLRGFDEVRMTLAIKTVEYPTKWSKEGIKFEERWILDSPLHEAQALTDSDSFLALLEFQPKIEKTSHGCYGLFNLFFYRKGERVGHLHYAHGQYWYPLTEKSQKQLNRWLTEHGFPIDEVIKKDRKEG
jgi:hypothetical protein